MQSNVMDARLPVSSTGSINDVINDGINDGINGGSLSSVTNIGTYSGSSSYMSNSAAVEAAADRAGSGRIGTLRRAFCLLALFDLIFTCILWIFYTRGFQDLTLAFKSQVLDYTFQSSVFDLVILSLVRFLLLEIFYALLRIKNPWVVAITTAMSTAFVIVKIIFYDYSKGHGIFDYLMPMMSLLLVWTETFLLDCKVLPVERADLISQSLSWNERSPLLGAQHQAAVGGGYARHSYVPSEGFVTPDSSPEGSDNEEAAPNGPTLPATNLPMPTDAENQRFMQRAIRLAEEAWQSLEDADWRCAHDRAPVRILSQKSRHRSSGKAWRLEVSVNLPAERLFQEIWDRVDRQADWNPTVLFSRVVTRLDENTCIVYNATMEAGGGLIKSRDFVTLCVRRMRDGIRYTGGVSIETALVPRADKYTRGENYPGCIACVPHGHSACRLVWIVDSDIKGWMPVKVIDQAMTNVLIQLGNSLYQHAIRIAQKESLPASNAPVV